MAGAAAVLVALALPAGALAQVSFRGTTNLPTGGDEPISVAVGDFDGNSDPDLTVAHNTSDDVSVLLGGAAGAA